MAIIKPVDNPVDNHELLFKLCHYITGDDGSIKRQYCFGRGVNPNNAFQEILYMQQLFGKTDKRRAYHLTVDFSDQESLTIQDAIEIGFELSNMFFPEYQVLFGVHGEHTGQKHLHLHFAINTVSLFGGRKLHLDFGLINEIDRRVHQLVEYYS